jgi:DNA-binding GntR family transcriptional regulator
VDGDRERKARPPTTPPAGRPVHGAHPTRFTTHRVRPIVIDEYRAERGLDIFRALYPIYYMQAELRRVDRSLLRDQAYRMLRDAIVSGELKPGEVIRDGELAERVGLSRTPVREALARLADEGLVETKPHAWTRVTPLGVREVRDALTVVRAMHELAVRLAVPLMTDRHHRQMRAANLRFAETVKAGEVEAAVEADDALHDVPIAVLGNRALSATIERQLPLIRRLERLRFGSLLGRSSIGRHDQLIEACEDRDVETAVAITTRIWTNLLDLLDNGGTRDDDG